jgi:hypothetical protein
MKIIYTCLLVAAAGWAQAATLPEVYVTEAPIAGGGIYTVYINQPPLEESSPWYLSAWGITNQAASFVDTGLTGWTAELFDDTTWNSELDFEISTPGDPVYLFTSGANGIGDFESVFGTGFSQAAVYWLAEYFGDPLVATSSNFTWSEGPGNSSAFAVISNAISGENLACGVGVGASATLSCTAIGAPVVPVPAAAWLFCSAVGLLGWIRRKTG